MTRAIAIAAKQTGLQKLSANWSADGSTPRGVYTGDDRNLLPDYLALKPKASDLQSIDLNTCMLDDEHLYRLLGTARTLQAFKFGIGHRW